jgi:hypothetical protein
VLLRALRRFASTRTALLAAARVPRRCCCCRTTSSVDRDSLNGNEMDMTAPRAFPLGGPTRVRDTRAQARFDAA